MRSSTDHERPTVGLRERKKAKTRAAIQRHALRLFREQGYDATTVDQIAEAAEISPSTFFRYFPTKEDVVLEDEYDPLIIEGLLAQPADLPPLEAVRRTVREILGALPDEEETRIYQRIQLSLEVPVLRARMWDGIE